VFDPVAGAVAITGLWMSAIPSEQVLPDRNCVVTGNVCSTSFSYHPLICKKPRDKAL